jgi:hypothetical protein
MKQNKRNNSDTYKDEGKHSKFVSNVHFIHDIERHNPLSIKYKSYWREIKRRCMEGYWVEGKWMPGNLYFYINLCVIELNENEYSKTKIEARPFLRDLEWEKAYVFMEARGFSGFALDDECSCFKDIPAILKLSEELRIPIVEDKLNEKGITVFKRYKIPNRCFNKNGKLKKFVPVREYLRKIHSKNLGVPLFDNDARNVIDFECRGSGKSYWAADGMILHNFLMDGSYNYDEYWQAKQNKKPMKSTTLVGAIDAFYSKSLLSKMSLAMNSLLGSQNFQGRFIPSPLSKDYVGSWNSGDQTIKALVDKNIGGKWVKRGSNAQIIHKSFMDNPHAGNGARASVACFEEVGFFSNLSQTLNSIKDTTYNGGKKFGTIYMFGTGGAGESGKSDEARDVFYDPESYDCLAFDDIWEETGSIGFFVPYELGLNEYKDPEGNTDIPAARDYIGGKREDAKKGKKKDAYMGELQNNPQKPSEAFLMQSSNIFPTAELKDQLGWVQSHQEDNFVKGMYGELVWREKDGKRTAVFLPDTTGVMRPTGYRMKKEEDTTGCVHIWEMPQTIDGVVPNWLYIAGTDPYDQDQSVATSSLGSTIIYKTFHTSEGLYEWPVAEYTARPERVSDHHENVLKLLTLYNARDLYENERNSMQMHFQQKGGLYLLTRTPNELKANEGSKVNRVYGQNMTKQVKDELEVYTRQHLLEDAGNGRLNLNNIYSIPLLEELIHYNRDGNFDRVIAFMLVVLHRQINYNKKVEAVKSTRDIDPFFIRGNGGKFFK